MNIDSMLDQLVLQRNHRRVNFTYDRIELHYVEISHLSSVGSNKGRDGRYTWEPISACTIFVAIINHCKTLLIQSNSILSPGNCTVHVID